MIASARFGSPVLYRHVPDAGRVREDDVPYGAVGEAGRPGPWRGAPGGAGETVDPPALLTPVGLLDDSVRRKNRRAHAEALQRHLHLLTAAEARLDVSIGEGLEALLGRFDLRALGHSHFDSLCTGTLGFSAAHGRELRTIARGLRDRPVLREAFYAGQLPRARLRLVLPVATPEDEAGWGQLARAHSTRELERIVHDVKAKRRPRPTVSGDAAGACADREASSFDPDADANEEPVFVRWRAAAADRGHWRFGRAMLRQVLGVNAPDAALAEALAAETLATLHDFDGGDDDADGGPEGACARGACASTGSRRRRRKVRASRLRKAARRLHRRLDARQFLPFVPVPDFDALSTAQEVGDALEGLVRRRHALGWERARLLAAVERRSLHRELGFRDFGAWRERCLGMAPREARRLIRLRARLWRLPSIDRAWREGRLSPHQVVGLMRVVEPETADDWLLYAEAVTNKALDAAVERVAATEEVRALPPWDADLRDLLLDWRAHFGVRAPARRRRRAAAKDAAAEKQPAEKPVDRLVRASRRDPFDRERWVGFTAPPAVARLWRRAQHAVRATSGVSLTDADVVLVMLRHFVTVHVNDAVLEHARRHAIMERDRWTCMMPHCRARGGFDGHHVRFRSHGGSDDPSNVVTLCKPCHAMVHAGFVAIVGEAPNDLVFIIGGRHGFGGVVDASRARAAYRGERRVELAMLSEERLAQGGRWPWMRARDIPRR